MRAGDLSKLSTNITWELLLSILARYRPRKQFSLRSGHLYFYTIQSLRTVYFSVLSNNLSNWCHEELFFAPTFYKKNSIFCRWKKSTRAFIPHLIVSVFSRFGAHSPVDLWQSLTSSGLEGILSNYMYLSVEEEGFPVWTSLLLFTVCQTPSVSFDMFNLGPTVTHIKIGPIVRRVPPIRNDHVYPCDSDRYQKELLCTNLQMEYTGTTGLDDVLASCNAG